MIGTDQLYLQHFFFFWFLIVIFMFEPSIEDSQNASSSEVTYLVVYFTTLASLAKYFLKVVEKIIMSMACVQAYC